MRFDGERFQKSINVFKYGKQDFKDDILFILGKISMNYIGKNGGEILKNMENKDEKLKEIFGEFIYKYDGDYIYLKESMNIFNLFYIPGKLIYTLLYRSISFTILMIITPFILLHSLVAD